MNPSYNTTEEFLRIALKQKQIPSILYKYCSVKTALLILGNNSVKFSTCKEFNDPFDCAIAIDGNNTYQEWRDYLIQQGASSVDAEILASKITSDPIQAERTIVEGHKRAIDEMGIFCMTTKNDNILMWSHYADFHKGVCLEFDISKDLKTFLLPRKVVYSNDYPKLNYIQSYLKNELKMHLALWHKSKDWEYEDEFRAIKPNKSGLIQFQKSSLTGIIFGCKCGEEKRKEIAKMVREKLFPNVKLKEASMSRAQYKLDIKEYKP